MKIVITGGPCSGKTTLIGSLKERGHLVLEEIAREVITEKGLNRALSTREAQELQTEIYRRQIEQESKIDILNAMVFLDRGYIDNQAYCMHHLGYVPKSIMQAPTHRYDTVFVLDRLPFENDGLRREDDAEASKIHGLLITTYRNNGYDPINVPIMRIQERTEYVIKKTNELQKIAAEA